MSAYTTGSSTPGSWEWPSDIPGRVPSTASQSTRSTEPETEPSRSSTSERPRPERHWKPRTCRICLETVLPTYHPPSESLPGFMQGAPSVTYDSDGGHLIRPCQCKGSSRYVHENCLQEWRHADPSYGRRNFWHCPTCGFKYRLERMQWGRWLSSKVTQVSLTLFILVFTVFLLGFIADPIINLYVDPWNQITPGPSLYPKRPSAHVIVDDDDDWFSHFIKGFASLGVLGFVKVFFASPWNWFNLRGIFGGSGGRVGTTGRERATSISWVVLIVGVCTFLFAVWKGVRAWTRRTLEKAAERVMDVQGDAESNDDDD